jgi:MFS family permease
MAGLIGGPVGDRFGPRRTLAFACLLMGIAGAARGLSNGFSMLAFTTLITGFAQWSIPMNIHIPNSIPSAFLIPHSAFYPLFMSAAATAFFCL